MERIWVAAIRRLMAAKGWNQQELAEAAGLRPNTLSDALNGKDSRISTFTAIAKGFGLPLWALFCNDLEFGVFNDRLTQRTAEDQAAKVLEDRRQEIARIVEIVLENEHARSQGVGTTDLTPAIAIVKPKVGKKKARR